MLHALAHHVHARCKANPVLRRWLKHPWLASLKARIACGLMVGDPEYDRWREARRAARSSSPAFRPEPGLLSFITPVWNTRPAYLRALYDSFVQQSPAARFEWMILDNGSSRRDTRAELRRIARAPWVRLVRSDVNLGISGGMRRCLELARGRYIAPVDHDDRLDPDAAILITAALQARGYPRLLYSDEDHLLGSRAVLPYFKPDWDPVLAQNSAYTAHLQVLDRKLALDLGVYSDPTVNGCADWDAVLRFASAGFEPIHLPEILYSWRMHPGSTSANAKSKSYIHASQTRALERLLSHSTLAGRFQIQLSPFFDNTPDFWLRRVPGGGPPFALALIGSDTGSAVAEWRDRTHSPQLDLHTADLADGWAATRALATRLAPADGLLALAPAHLRPSRPDWPWEALGLFERFPETAAAGGVTLNTAERIADGPRVLFFQGDHRCPDLGRSATDSGYFVQLFKQRSVAALGAGLVVYRARFLRDVLSQIPASCRSLAALGLWAGFIARSQSLRLIDSPFLRTFEHEGPLDTSLSAAELSALKNAARSIPPDRRYYPPHLSLEVPYRPDVAAAQLPPVSAYADAA